MSYGITFYNRAFGKMAQPAVKMVVDRLQWVTAGGASLAEGRAFGDERQLLGLAELLRCPVTIWNRLGDEIWWGYLEGITFDGISFDLARLANRIQANYTYTVDQGGTYLTVRNTTPWGEDLGSQADYGIKEKMIAAGGVTLNQAQSERDQALAHNSRPTPALSLGTKMAPGTDSQTFATLTLKGWYQTLGWRYYSNAKGQESYPTEGIGTQAIGDLAAETYLAQKFQLPNYGWDCNSGYLKIAKAGAPADSLGIAIQADNAGQPSGANLTAGYLAGSSVSLDYGWMKIDFSPTLTLGGGIYWLNPRGTRAGR